MMPVMMSMMTMCVSPILPMPVMPVMTNPKPKSKSKDVGQECDPDELDSIFSQPF